MFWKGVGSKNGAFMNFEISLDQEVDGRWIASSFWKNDAIPELPGVIVYGETPLQAEVKAKALALRVLADRMENDEPVPAFDSISFVSPKFGDHHEPVVVN